MWWTATKLCSNLTILIEENSCVFERKSGRVSEEEQPPQVFILDWIITAIGFRWTADFWKAMLVEIKK
ncbi:MAG: hypothetical protein PHZ25_01470 [Candidatus Pacebacteria bacterium]|nr:hypothetical protein [Candidatus Paceibacterota bacterium]